MSWIHFLLWVLGLYTLYYLAMILWDVSRHRGQDALKQSGAELTFTGLQQPKIAADILAEYEEPAAAPVNDPSMVLPEVIASGGVLLKDVFNLARKEVIVYTRQVSFNEM